MRRDPLLLAAGLIFAAVTAIAVTGSLAWIGRPFPGFLLLGNRVVASAGLTHWTGTPGGEIYQHEVVEVDGAPLRNARDLDAAVRAKPPGTPIHYRFVRGDRDFLRTIPTRVFGGADYALLFGALLVNALAFAGVAFLIRFLRGGDRLATGSVPILFIAGTWAVTALDLYGPYHLFRLHALCETLLFAGTLHMALVFPHPTRLVERWPRLAFAPYLAALPLAVANQLGLHHPPTYVATHLVATSAFGASLCIFIASQLRWYLRPPDFQARQRVKMVVFGAVLALSPGVIVALGEYFTGGETPQNLLAFTAAFYPMSIGYAVLRDDLLEIDRFLRRSLSYAFLTGLATIGYLSLAQGLGFLSQRSTGAPSDFLGFAFSLLCVIIFLGLRDRVQTALDRIFFRTAYDLARLVETTSARLASVADLRAIADEISRAVGEALHPEHLALHVAKVDGEGLVPIGDGAAEIPVARIGAERLARAREPLDTEDGGLCIPFRVEGRLVAALWLGRRRSGRIYGGDDRRLLKTLAHQGAVAIENALALERLRDLNRDLEGKVGERTRELRETQVQLVHREKMASLGQFVAGIAHELNNPLNFVHGNIHCLREYVDAIALAFSRLEVAAQRSGVPIDVVTSIRKDHDLDTVLGDLDSTFAGCDEGIARTTALVRDLRTFSRLDLPDYTTLALHEALESTLTVLRSKLTGIEVVKRFAVLPDIECLPGQINQVLMNLIANAADATAPSGRIEIRTEPAGDGRVAVEIEDDGCGIPAQALERIFDPFYTTKAVGKGTGLGLSVSYGIVNRHGGTIRARSEPGHGTCFRVELPVRAPSEAREHGAQPDEPAER